MVAWCPPWILCGSCLDLDPSGFGWINLGLGGLDQGWPQDLAGFWIDPVWGGFEWIRLDLGGSLWI